MSKKEEISKEKKTNVKVKEKDTKKVKQTSKKAPKKVKKESFFTGVRKEMKKVRWPLKKEMVKYSIATLSFIVFFIAFFAIADLIIAGVKVLVA